MLGDTPNLQMTLANNTDRDIELDMSKFQVTLEDGTPIDFHLTKKTIPANTPYAQNAFTASEGSLKVGDSVKVTYGEHDLGVYSVSEF